MKEFPALKLVQQNNLQSSSFYSPLISSDALGWEQISLAYYCHSAGVLPLHCSLHHEICINLGEPVLLEQSIDGRYGYISSASNQIGLYPANLTKSFRWNQKVKFLQLYLKPTLLSQIGEEIGTSEPIELIPQTTRFFDPLIKQIALALKNALENNASMSRLYADLMANALAIHLLSQYSTKKLTVQQPVGQLSQKRLQPAIDYIHENLGENISLKELATIVRLSSWHFAHLFKETMGISPHQYHIKCRINRAKQLLREKNMTIIEISQMFGFSNQSHFNYHFKRLTGMTPTAFLKQ